jgi:ribosomal protein L21E
MNDFQIDMIKCNHIEFAKFYFSYSDFGSIMGKIIKKNNMTFGHNGLFLEIQNHQLLLTKDVNEFCKFITIDFTKWKSIKTKIDLFEFIKSSRFYKPELFKSGNYDHRSRIKTRPIYNEFIKYICINQDLENEDFKNDKSKKEPIIKEALDFFHKHEEVEIINKSIQKAKIIHNKFNGNMLKEMGYDGASIGIIIKAFKNTHPNFDEWIYNTDTEDIIKALNNIILSIK